MEFTRQAEKMNVKFHKNCENIGKILKISCASCHFVKFDINFPGPPYDIVFVVIAHY